MHIPVLRRTDFDTLQLILGGDPALLKFDKFPSDVGKLLSDLTAQILINLNDLELYLRDLGFGLSGSSHQLTTFAFELGGVTLQAGHPRYGNQIFLEQFLDAL